MTRLSDLVKKGEKQIFIKEDRREIEGEVVMVGLRRPTSTAYFFVSYERPLKELPIRLNHSAPNLYVYEDGKIFENSKAKQNYKEKVN